MAAISRVTAVLSLGAARKFVDCGIKSRFIECEKGHAADLLILNQSEEFQ